MNSNMGIFAIIITSIFISNVIFAKFLGCCPFFGVSKKLDASLGMGMAVIFVITLASGVTWVANHFLLSKDGIIAKKFGLTSGLEYLQTIAFILIIAALVQFVEMAIAKFSPGLYKALGIFLPLITTNCAVLGVALWNMQYFSNSFIKSVVNGFSVATGFAMALIILAGIREKLDITSVPKPFKGLPIAFVTAGILAMAFMGFSGMHV